MSVPATAAFRERAALVAVGHSAADRRIACSGPGTGGYRVTTARGGAPWLLYALLVVLGGLPVGIVAASAGPVPAVADRDGSGTDDPARDWRPRPESARFQRLGTDQGLSQSTVLAIATDHRGRVWLGTQAGLNRYDGYEVQVFRPGADDPAALSDNFVTALAVEPGGAIWAATLDGLNRIDPDRGHAQVFRHSDDDPHSVGSSRLAALHADRSGRIWVGSEHGVSRWRGDAGGFDNWSHAAGNADGLPDDRITTLASDRDGRLLVGTVAGLARFDPARGRFEVIAPDHFNGVEITAVLEDRQGRLWVATDGNGVMVDPGDGRWQSLQTADGLASDAARSLLQDRAGRIWIGTDLGLDMLAEPAQRPWQVANFRHQRHNPDSLGGGRVSVLHEDEAGSLWVGTWNSGASWLSAARNRFDSFTADQPVTAGFRNPSSISLAAAGQALWIGSGEGIYHFDSTGYRLTAVGDPDDQITVFSARAAADAIWFGTSRGLRRLDPATRTVSAPSVPTPLDGLRIRRLWLDPQRVWLAADPRGLAVLDRDLRQLQQLHPISRSVTFIEPLGPHTRLVGAYDGLYWFDSDTGELRHAHRLLTEASSQEGLGAAPMAFARGADGRLWLATNGAGLREILLPDPAQPAGATFVSYGAAHGLTDLALKALEIDRRGVLWISTASGIVAFDPTRERFVEFGRRDGTLGHDYINGASTVFDDGRLAFGAMEGFTLFDPLAIDLEPPLPPPAPLITALEFDGARSAELARSALDAIVADDAPLQLPAGSARSFSIRFAAPDLIRADALRYQYRLHGFSPEWTSVDPSRRIASYTNLEPGDYRFEVRAASPRSDWSTPTVLSFEIAPHWWQTWWARAAAVLALAALIIAVYLQRLRIHARRNAQLTRLVAERTAALEDAKTRAEHALQQLESTQQELVRAEKMAALGQLVAGVAHEVNTPLGVAVTASSYVGDAGHRLREAVASGSLKRSDLATFLDSVDESNLMIQRNLDRAAQLIANFKQVSVDRSSDGRRQFELRPYLDELLQSLRLMWKRRAIVTEVECDPDIELDGFPGALGQVITNLMQNSVRHAFPDGRDGVMRLTVRHLDAGHIELLQSDNGVGIPAANLERIWEPFFTTQRGHGGTGLGLHIVYNLVTQKLGGTIRVDSTLGEGTRFTLVLPMRAPD